MTKKSSADDIKDCAPSSTSERALEKEGDKALIDEPTEKRKIKGETFLQVHLLAGPHVCVQEGDSQVSLQAEPLRLYGELGPRDGADAILAALAVASTEAGLDCFNRAGRCDDDSRARNLNLGLGLKSALVARDLLNALDSRRSQNAKRVNVGKVNVESGGQAIVGNVERPETSDPERRRRKTKG